MKFSQVCYCNSARRCYTKDVANITPWRKKAGELLTKKAKFNTYLDEDLIKDVKTTAVWQSRRPAGLVTDALNIYLAIANHGDLLEDLTKEANNGLLADLIVKKLSK